MDLAELRKSRGRNSIADIQKKVQEQSSGGKKKYEKDERFWTMEADEAGNASSVIRFLPKTDQDALPWVRIFNHGFQGPTGKWYIENSLSTLGKSDPVGDLNSKLWNSGIEANKNIVRKQKRKTKYICNILVIKDSKNPENEGKVKLFSFGKSIFDMISDKINPKFEDDIPVDVFDTWEGADFKFRMVRGDGGYANFDKSSFSNTSELCDGDEEEILRVLNSRYFLGEFIAEDKFKSYEELKARLDVVLSDGNSSQQSTAEDDAFSSVPVEEEREIPQAEEKPIKSKPAPKTTKFDEDEDEDEMSFFKDIVKK